MSKKKKTLARLQKRGAKKTRRKKSVKLKVNKNRALGAVKKKEFKKIIDKANVDNKFKPPLYKRVIAAIQRTILKILIKTMCLFGFHAWVLRTGVPGSPKYLCRHCFKESKKFFW